MRAVFPDVHALSAAATEHILAAVQKALQGTSVFHLVLTGGSTPRTLYRSLASAPHAIDWSRVRFYFGDERTVPPDHPDSNYGMAAETLLRPLGIPVEHVLRMEGELPPAEAADRYETALRRIFGDTPRFDLLLLGMGDDGHIASLFPFTDALQERTRWVVANPVPAHNTMRLTFTYTVIEAAREVLFLVSGANKAQALRAVLEGAPDPIHFPAQAVRTVSGRVKWMIDEAAAALLTQRSGTTEGV